MAATLTTTVSARITHAASATQFSSFSRKSNFFFIFSPRDLLDEALNTLVEHERRQALHRCY